MPLVSVIDDSTDFSLTVRRSADQRVANQVRRGDAGPDGAAILLRVETGGEHVGVLNT